MKKFLDREGEECRIGAAAMRMNQKTLLALSFSMLLTAPQLCAQTVAWGTSGSSNPLVFTSDGAQDGNEANTSQTLTWELGWFSDGYVPDGTNWTSWAANWHTASSLVPEVDPFPVDPDNPGLINYPYHRYFSETGDWAVSVNTYNVNAYGETVPPGKQAYVFVHNGGTNKNDWAPLIGTPQGEVLLYRQDGLLLPTASQDQITFDIADNPMDSSDNAFTVIWGRVDRNMKALGGVLQGSNSVDMVISNPKPDSAAVAGKGTFEAQTATWVPEPGSFLLVGMGGLLAALRRRREA